MSKPVVLVIGSTGYIGSATVAALSSKYADKVEIRAGVRNPDKADKLKALANVTVVQATQGDKDQLAKVLPGVHTLYIVTPGVENRAELAISTAEAAKIAGVKHIAVVSSPSVAEEHPDHTLFGRQFNKIEMQISALGVPYTFIRLPYFVEFLFSIQKETIVRQQKMYGPVDPEKNFTPVVVEDAGKASAAILVSPERHANKTYCVVSDGHTYNDAAKAFSEALGKEISYVRVPYPDAKKTYLGMGFPEWVANGVLEINHLIDGGSPATNQADLSAFTQITGEQPTDLKTWVKEHAPEFQ